MSPDSPPSDPNRLNHEEQLHPAACDKDMHSASQIGVDTAEGASPALNILWDGESAAVLYKPAGIPTQGPPQADSLEQRAKNQFATRSHYFACPHRLDRPVQGVILVAFQKRTARLLSSQFEARKVEKEYLAWSAGRMPPEPTQWIDHLKKVPGQAKVTIADEAREGSRLAKTEVQPLHYSTELDCTLVKLKPVTGRMHQLRVQAAHRGYPILGDTTYASASYWFGPAPVRSHMSIESDSEQGHLERQDRTAARISLMRSLGMPLQSTQVDSAGNATGSLGTGSNATDSPKWIALRAQTLRFFDPRDARRVEVSADQLWIESSKNGIIFE
ncbi:MAG: RNA pseudouridine synthase [Rubripirellula sp.]|nr:RNA pseudouridine synthase [Rubripirellula sp.]